MEYPWNHSRRFNAYSEYFRNTFGQRVQKVSIDAGFTCPNRDGTAGNGGCTYCNNNAFNPSYCHPSKPVRQQIDEGIEFHRIRYRRASEYLAYFQTYSNTYAPLSQLKQIYDQALSHPGIKGLVIGTRPDCIDDEKISYFSKLSEKYYIIIEYGIESTSDETLKIINRGHTFRQSEEAIKKTAAAGIKTGAHLIFGLPGETGEQMIEGAKMVAKLPLTTIKFHQLQIVRNTAMADQYLADPGLFKLFPLKAFINHIVRITEIMNPAFVIERFTGEVPPRFLISQPWSSLRADQVAKMIEMELERQNTWQGKYYNND